MQQLILGASAPIVTLVDGQPVTTSTEVARVFGKEHRHVLDAIRALVIQMPENRLPDFRQTVETRPNPSGGAPIESPAYQLTQDGFTLLAMGFTGRKALAFKLAYIDAFNRMKAELARPASHLHDCLKLANAVQEAALGALLDAVPLEGERYVFSFDSERVFLRRIERDDFIVSMKTLPDRLCGPDCHATSDELMAISVAATTTLAKQARRRQRPALPPAVE